MIRAVPERLREGACVRELERRKFVIHRELWWTRLVKSSA